VHPLWLDSEYSEEIKNRDVASFSTGTSTSLFTVAAAKTIENINAGLLMPGNVKALVTDDINGNRKCKDSKKSNNGVPGVTVEVLA
jgi:hypothetical protein